MKLLRKNSPQKAIHFDKIVMSRDKFSRRILESTQVQILEIGPLNRPLITGPQAMYFDLLPTELLRLRAEAQGLDPNSVPEIHFHDQQGDLSKINRKFGGAVSAHCLEHQPDLISHLKHVSVLLEGKDSFYSVILPDKRYCFDALLPESKISEVVEAFELQHTHPSIWKVIEDRALTSNNDPIRHWNGDHGETNIDLVERWKKATEEYKNSKGEYIDVHCWQFTPESFVKMINGLFELGYIDFVVEELFETAKNDLEFFVILRKN